MKRKFLSLLLISILSPALGNAQDGDVQDAEAATGTTVVLSDQDKQNILQLHNKARCDLAVPAAAMPNVVWNDLLYKVAQNYANKCVFQHNGNRSNEYAALGGKGYVGENIYMISGVKPGVYTTSAINGFVSEKVNFAYMDPSACKKSGSICGCKTGKVCGHYTQVIWDHTTSIACAQADCTNTPLKGQFVVCDYAPGGNYISTEPYISSQVSVNTAACQAAYSNPASADLSFAASSDQDHVATLLDGNPSTFWSPNDTDANPNITLSLNHPLNVDHLKVQWSDANHSAKSVQIEYATQEDGSDLTVLPTQSLSEGAEAKINVNLTQIRLLKIKFLDAYDSKIQVSGLEPVYR